MPKMISVMRWLFATLTLFHIVVFVYVVVEVPSASKHWGGGRHKASERDDPTPSPLWYNLEANSAALGFPFSLGALVDWKRRDVKFSKVLTRTVSILSTLAAFYFIVRLTIWT